MRETVTRTISGLIYILLLLSATLYSRNAYLIVFGFFLVLSVYEFCKLIQLKKSIAIPIALLGYILFTYSNSFDRLTDLLLTTATLFVSIKLIFALFKDQRLPLDTFSKYIYLTGYIVLPLILLTKIPFINAIYRPEMIISVFILIWANDTFAYVVGKSIGKRKLLEKISPKKTVEGFLGGFFFTLLFSVLIAYYLNQSLFIWLISAIITVLFGTIGDLIESKFKRMVSIKDSGKIMPGHGGMLDRLDSIIFVSPFLYLFYQILNYVS